MEDPAEGLILLAEDNDGDVRLTISAFQDADVKGRIHVVADGEAAIAFLKSTGIYEQVPRPVLVLLDLNLPKVDGFQVLTEMKADPDLQTIPVVVMTSSDRGVDRAKAHDLQASDYLVKPMDLGEYFRAIRLVKESWLVASTSSPPEADHSH